MSESRQQRRARERAEQKTASRPGPRVQQSSAAAVRRPHVVVASLNRFVDDEDPDWVCWSCEYELRGESVGIDDSGNPDLHDVVNGVLDYARRWSDRYDITIEWTVDGDPPEDGTVEDAIAALGVTLPIRIPN